MKASTRQSLLLRLTRRLVICTGCTLAVILLFLFALLGSGGHSYLTLIVFACGLVGGFVSIQQRTHRISDLELRHLSESWAGILLIPIYGGIFALVIHVIFIAGIISGELFPAYWTPEFGKPPTLADFQAFFNVTLPASGPDTAKMLFWAFCAGFSERLVPQIIQNVQSRLTDADKDEDDDEPARSEPAKGQERAGS